MLKEVAVTCLKPLFRNLPEEILKVVTPLQIYVALYVTRFRSDVSGMLTSFVLRSVSARSRVKFLTLIRLNTDSASI
jgi:hypothetical protein